MYAIRSYYAEMIVRHAELDSVRNYFRKMYTYGRYRTASHHIMPVRSLTAAERWEAFRSTARPLGLIDSIKLFGRCRHRGYWRLESW